MNHFSEKELFGVIVILSLICTVFMLTSSPVSDFRFTVLILCFPVFLIITGLFILAPYGSITPESFRELIAGTLKSFYETLTTILRFFGVRNTDE
jgi:hypothetical protein